MQYQEVNITDLVDAEAHIVEDLRKLGIKVNVNRLGDKHYACRARYPDARDPIVTYAKTPEEAVRQTTNNVRSIWSELFESRS